MPATPPEKLPTVFVVQEDWRRGEGQWRDLAEHDSRAKAIQDAQSRYYRGGPDIRVVRVRKAVIW